MSNSLSPDVRFATDTVVYALTSEPGCGLIADHYESPELVHLFQAYTGPRRTASARTSRRAAMAPCAATR